MKKIIKTIFGILLLPFLYFSILSIFDDIDKLGLIKLLVYAVTVLIFTAFILDIELFKYKDKSFYALFIVTSELLLVDFIYIDLNYFR